ncbi:MAG TPA: hypothetical protein VK915_06415 [Gaiellaceae bacterium]|nr:hypothetical protein [Gaiellaceae bacterium]
MPSAAGASSPVEAVMWPLGPSAMATFSWWMRPSEVCFTASPVNGSISVT